MQGIKFDGDKPEYSLLPKGTLQGVLRVLGYGKKKYTQVVETPFEDIKKEVEEGKWRNEVIVNRVESLEISLAKGYAPLATETQHLLKLNVNLANKLENSQQKLESVGHVLNASDWQTSLTNWLVSELIEKHIPYEKATENKSESEVNEDVKIQSLSLKKNEETFYETLQNMGCRKKTILLLLQEDAQSVEAKNAHILTMTMKQGDFEICCVVSATKLSVCYKIILLLLQLFLNTSPDTKVLTKIQTGKDNWQYVDNSRERYYNAAMRHLTSWWEGEKKDPETGENHLSHAVCCLLFLLWFDNKDTGKN